MSVENGGTEEINIHSFASAHLLQGLICNSPGILDSNSRGDFHHRRVLGTLILKLTMSPARDRCAMNFFRVMFIDMLDRACRNRLKSFPFPTVSTHLNTELIETVARKIAFLLLISPISIKICLVKSLNYPILRFLHALVIKLKRNLITSFTLIKFKKATIMYRSILSNLKACEI